MEGQIDMWLVVLLGLAAALMGFMSYLCGLAVGIERGKRLQGRLCEEPACLERSGDRSFVFCNYHYKIRRTG